MAESGRLGDGAPPAVGDGAAVAVGEGVPSALGDGVSLAPGGGAPSARGNGVRAALRAASGLDQPAFTIVLSEQQVHAALADVHAAPGESPLAGMTFAVKDNIDLLGVATTAACPILDTPAIRSATAVERAVAAGAIPIGKTNMDQFATGLVGTRTPYGACHSIASAAHVSGGSSSGSAIAVAAGVVDFALGTDTAGSGRVPAAFNGLVGMKPSRGLISNRGLMPASPSLDCVTVFSKTVELARHAFEALVAPDVDDPYSRPLPPALPAGVARRMRFVGVPSVELDLDEPHQLAWKAALAHAASVGRLVPVDVEPFLAAAQMLYAGPMVAERLAAFGELLEPDGPHLDPAVRQVVLAARTATAVEAYEAQHQLAELAALGRRAFASVDAVLLPVTPGHPTLAEVAADPIGVNSRLGVYTNMVNLLDLCAVAVPAGQRGDGLPFGVQLIAPTFADRPLLDLAARWCGEADAEPTLPEHRTLLAVVRPRSPLRVAEPPRSAIDVVALVELGARLHARAHTAPGYQVVTVGAPSGLARTGDRAGEAVELWDVSRDSLRLLLQTIPEPLELGLIELDDGHVVSGLLASQR